MKLNVEIKPQYETLCGLEPEGNQDSSVPVVDALPEVATKGEEKPYIPNFEGTILEGDDLERLKGLVDSYSDVFAKHAEDVGMTSLLYHHTKIDYR